MRTFDVVVIGGGPAGEVAAGRLAGDGLSVALVERELVGGECSYWGCMPSKALLRPAEAIAETRRIPGAAEAITGSIDVTAVLRRRDEIIHDLDDSSQLPWLEDRGVELIRGEAVVTGERRVTVGDEEIEVTKAVVLASGTKALIPPIDGLRDAKPWTNREITTAKHVPASLVILGGGFIGCEMAQAYSSLGSKVALVEGEDRLLGRVEPYAADQVTEALRAAGVEIRLGKKAASVTRASGEVIVTLDDGERVIGEEIVVAIGRRPNTEAVEGLGYEPGKPIEVDETTYRTKDHDWLFAIGDVNGVALLTHMGKYQAAIVADLLADHPTQPQQAANGPRSPHVIFTDPQIGAVGHTEASAKEAGIDVRTVEVETSGNAGGSFYGRNAPGTTKLVVDGATDVVIGATVTGAEVADFLQPFTIAVSAEMTTKQLWHAVPVFPTRSELWLRLLESYAK